MPRGRGRGRGGGGRGGAARRGRRRTTRRRRRVRRRRVMLVGGLVGYGVYKMSTRDAERVEQHSGASPEEMTDEELAQAMDQLGIEKQRIESSDQEVDDSTAAQSSGTGSVAEELTKLAALHDQGVLTDAEFDAQKQKLLGD